MIDIQEEIEQFDKIDERLDEIVAAAKLVVNDIKAQGKIATAEQKKIFMCYAAQAYVEKMNLASLLEGADDVYEWLLAGTPLVGSSQEETEEFIKTKAIKKIDRKDTKEVDA